MDRDDGPTPPTLADSGDPAVPFYGFCPDDAPPGPVARPRLFELLRTHSDELVDRFNAMRRERRGSTDLRAGVRAVLGRDGAEAALSRLRQAPDRMEDGFDFAEAAMVLLGVRALADGDAPAALRHGRLAAQEQPRDPAAHALVALAAANMGDAGAERAALRKARALDDAHPAIALALGRNLAHTPDLDEAVAALDVYLRDTSEDVAVAQLRARLATQREIQRGFRRHSSGGVTLVWPPGALDDAVAEELQRELREGLDEAADMLGMAPREELHAVVFRERSELLATTCVPTWTAGVFDGTLRLYAEPMREAGLRRRVVRHEVLHAQLRAERLPAPHWFHEGVAQHFAREAHRGHLRSYRVMVDNHTYIPFASLEGSFLVIDRSRDARLAYHQSLAMVELMIDRFGDRALPRAVDFLRQGGDPSQLLQYVAAPRGLDGDDLLSFLRRKLAAGGTP
ncbi:MAG: tetratricopeptide repeat protein [Myxococcales bacterium]